jgi:hypothetical protein
MRNQMSALALFILGLLPTTLLAGPVPYQNIGQIAPTTTITATASSDIIGYFVQASSVYSDVVRMVDVTTGATSAWFFPNQTTAVGTSADFGYVNNGDTLIFEIDVFNIQQVFASDPDYSFDEFNHGYVTSFAGGLLYGSNIPAGIYVGMEDLNASNSDWDYNDDTFLFTNLSSKGFDNTPQPTPDDLPIPEPNTLVLLGTGFVALAGAIRHRRTAH